MYKMTTLMMILSFSLTSCCSLACNRSRQVTVTAQQSGTKVIIDGYDCGTTPLLVDLEKAYNHTIIVSKPGYHPQKAYLKSRHTVLSGGNVASPIIGAVVGTGMGLALHGTNGYISPYFLGGTLLGGVVGLGICVIGVGTDLYSRSDCDLDKKAVHFNLIQEN